MAHASTIAHTRPAASGGMGQGLLSLLLGAGFTLALFLGIARFDLVEPTEPPDDILDLRAVSIQEPPPPPRETQREPVPLEATLTGFDPAPSDSPVQIAITPPDLESLLPPPPLAPPAMIQAGQLYTDLKPKMDITLSGDHIYQMSEVDQLPKALHRVTPFIPLNVRKNASMLRVSVIFVVNAKGEIGNVRIASSSGNPEFDAIVMNTIREWSFSPAIRKGKKVSSLLQQATIIKFPRSSQFEL